MEEPRENKLLFDGGGDDFHNFEVFQSFFEVFQSFGGCLTYIVAALVVLLVMVVILR